MIGSSLAEIGGAVGEIQGSLHYALRALVEMTFSWGEEEFATSLCCYFPWGYFPLLSENAGDFSEVLRVMSSQPEGSRRRSATDIFVSARSGMFFMLPAPDDSLSKSSAKKILRGEKDQVRLCCSPLCGGLI